MCENTETTKTFNGIAPFDNNSLPVFVVKKREVELNETPENKQNGLRELKRMIQDEKTINGIDFHEDFLTQYLRRHRYQVAGAFSQIRSYVAFRRKESALFQTISDGYFTEDGIRTILKVLPFRCPDGCPVIYFRFGEWNSDKMPFDDLQRLVIMAYLQLFRDPMTQINGLKAIYDFKGTSFHHLKIATIRNAYLYYSLVMNCFPGRYKGLHIVNESLVVKAMWFIIKQFLPEKIKNRTHFHSKPEDLLNYFPRSMLPTEYGGELIESDIRDWLRIVNQEHKNNSIGGQPNFY